MNATFIKFEEWIRMLIKWMWQAFFIFLFFELLLFALYKPVPECGVWQYFKLFILTPTILQGLLIIIFQMLNRSFFKKVGEQWAVILTQIIITTFFGIMVGVHSSVSEMGALIVYPIFLANVYRKKKYILTQAGISLVALILLRSFIIPYAPYKPVNSDLVITIIFVAFIIGSVFGTGLIQRFVVQMDVNITLSRNKEKKMKELVRRDSLTGLLNHKAFYDELQKYIDKSIQFERKVSLLVIDIDDFKMINDQYGHANGDKVILVLTRILKNNVRAEDAVARYGGEEFAVILWDTNILKANKIAERIRIQFNSYNFGDEFKNNHFGVSIGIAEYYLGMGSIEDFFKAADYALYSAKDSGKNVVKF